ncbi:MAG: hypothetical protein KR126chlam1_01220 [Chlamydiae bacterium]|nr:hypothetical protein [Chlamydiota bacterium]
MLKEKYFHAERRLSLFLKKHSITILRIAMGIIYFWYGFLKVIGISPAEELVFRTTHWIGVHNFVIFLGYWEVAIGLCLFIRKFNRLGLLLLFLQFPGTFLPLFLTPEDCFTIFPYGLTLEGQYILKNLILVSAGLVLIGSLYKKGPSSSN